MQGPGLWIFKGNVYLLRAYGRYQCCNSETCGASVSLAALASGRRNPQPWTLWKNRPVTCLSWKHDAGNRCNNLRPSSSEGVLRSSRQARRARACPDISSSASCSLFRGMRCCSTLSILCITSFRQSCPHSTHRTAEYIPHQSSHVDRCLLGRDQE